MQSPVAGDFLFFPNKMKIWKNYPQLIINKAETILSQPYHDLSYKDALSLRFCSSFWHDEPKNEVSKNS